MYLWCGLWSDIFSLISSPSGWFEKQGVSKNTAEAFESQINIVLRLLSSY